MAKIFSGLLLVFLEFNIQIDSMLIGLLPDFIGYYLIRSGLVSLMHYGGSFVAAHKLSGYLFVYALAQYLLNLTGIYVNLGILSFLIGLAGTVCSISLTRRIALGIKDVEAVHACDLHADKLYAAWKVLAVSALLAYLLTAFGLLALLAILVSIAATIYFLSTFSKTKSLFADRIGPC